MVGYYNNAWNSAEFINLGFIPLFRGYLISSSKTVTLVITFELSKTNTSIFSIHFRYLKLLTSKQIFFFDILTHVFHFSIFTSIDNAVVLRHRSIEITNSSSTSKIRPPKPCRHMGQLGPTIPVYFQTKQCVFVKHELPRRQQSPEFFFFQNRGPGYKVIDLGII